MKCLVMKISCEKLWRKIGLLKYFGFYLIFFFFDFINDEIWVRIFNKIFGFEKVEDVKFYEIKDVFD